MGVLHPSCSDLGFGALERLLAARRVPHCFLLLGARCCLSFSVSLFSLNRAAGVGLTAAFLVVGLGHCSDRFAPRLFVRLLTGMVPSWAGAVP